MLRMWRIPREVIPGAMTVDLMDFRPLPASLFVAVLRILRLLATVQVSKIAHLKP